VTRGRRPLPAQVHLLHGNPSKLSQEALERAAAQVPVAQEALPVPRWLKGVARREWQWIAPRLFRYQLLTEIDRVVLETYCQAYARWREAEEHLAEAPKVLSMRRPDGSDYFFRNPWLGISKDALKQVHQCLDRLGMNPAARATILSKPRDEPPNGNPGDAGSSRADPLGILR